jgi:hypothetical protein
VNHRAELLAARIGGIDPVELAMCRPVRGALLLVGSVLALGCGDASSAPTGARPPLAAVASSGRVGFGFNGTVSGFPTGAVRLTGGGSYAPATAANAPGAETDVKSAGGFDCAAGVGQGPLAGCAAGEGVRWDTVQLLASTTFKCTGAAAEAPKTAATGAGTAVLQADFYRAGDGVDESFTAQMIVAAADIAPDVPGAQTLWVQGVGCGTANAQFSK